MSDMIGSMCYDAYGRPFVVLKAEAEDETVQTGQETIRSNILAAQQVAKTLRTSLGPKGLDKLLVSPDGNVVVTNDGATILELMDVEHEVAKLIVEVAKAQDCEVGDGTTGVVVLAGALLEKALELLDKGVHPSKVADGYESAARSVIRHLEKISVRANTEEDKERVLLQAAMTSLSSKIANKCQRHLAEIAVAAVNTTCDLHEFTPEVHVNSIVLRGKSGGQIEDTELIKGVIIERDFAHSQMKKNLQKVKVAVFSSCALQLPVINNKHHLDVTRLDEYNGIDEYINAWSSSVLKTVVDSGATLVVYSSKIDDCLIHSFLQHGISCIESVRDVEILAKSVGAHVVPKIEELSEKKLGRVETVRIIDIGTTNEKLIALEQEGRTKIVTILVRGSNAILVEEIKRSLQDALCIIRNLTQDNATVYGGGASEISCSLALEEESLKKSGVEQLVFQAFAEALDVIPLTLAQNSGLFPLQVLSHLKASHSTFLGVDCMLTGSCDMRSQGVMECLSAKKQQVVLATQLAKMVLKIDDIRALSSMKRPQQ